MNNNTPYRPLQRLVPTTLVDMGICLAQHSPQSPDVISGTHLVLSVITADLMSHIALFHSSRFSLANALRRNIAHVARAQGYIVQELRPGPSFPVPSPHRFFPYRLYLRLAVKVVFPSKEPQNRPSSLPIPNSQELADHVYLIKVYILQRLHVGLFRGRIGLGGIGRTSPEDDRPEPE